MGQLAVGYESETVGVDEITICGTVGQLPVRNENETVSVDKIITHISLCWRPIEQMICPKNVRNLNFN